MALFFSFDGAWQKRRNIDESRATSFLKRATLITFEAVYKVYITCTCRMPLYCVLSVERLKQGVGNHVFY